MRDLAFEIAHDREFPRHARRLDTIIEYLMGRDAAKIAIHAAVDAWTRYKESNDDDEE
jgi:hypothetical protein